MSFKDEYKELQRQISPDEKFIERLAEKLQNEQSKNKKNKARFRTVILSSAGGFAAAAATLVIIANLPRPHQPQPDPPPDILNVGADKIDYQDGLFLSPEIESAAVSSADLAEILANENSTVYCSDESTFDFDDKIEREYCRDLARRFENAAETSSEPSGDVKYYMAVSESGDVVKFSVSGNILIIEDKRYELS